MEKVCSGMIEEWNMDQPKSCCSDWDTGVKLLDAPIMLLTVRSGGSYKYQGKPFKFCPWCGRNVNSAKTVYDPNIKMPPKEVTEAAKLVENYFGENHMGDWEFMGLRNRFPKL